MGTSSFFLGGICFRQPRENIAGDQVAEQIRFSSFRDVLHVIDFAAAQGFDHERAVVFEGDEVHPYFLFLTGTGGGRSKACVNRSMAPSTCRWIWIKAARAWRRRR